MIRMSDGVGERLNPGRRPRKPMGGPGQPLDSGPGSQPITRTVQEIQDANLGKPPRKFKPSPAQPGSGKPAPAGGPVGPTEPLMPMQKPAPGMGQGPQPPEPISPVGRPPIGGGPVGPANPLVGQLGMSQINGLRNLRGQGPLGPASPAPAATPDQDPYIRYLMQSMLAR